MADTDITSGAPERPGGGYRWTICGLLFFATTINYIDRAVLGLLAPDLQHIIGWNEVEYGYIVTAFQAAYAIGLVLFGRFIDKYGTKIGYSISIAGWSIAAMAHALATSAFGFGIARFFLGASESGNFPAAIKAVAEWFPKKERALATGIFNSGANIGSVVAPAIVPWLTITFGWYGAFLATGALGFVWLALWLLFYERPEAEKRLKQQELRWIQSDPPEPESDKIPWIPLLAYRQTWAFVIGKFLTDPIWWFYLYWLPKFLNSTYGLSLTSLGLPLISIYMMTTVGSIGGGWLSSTLITRGWSINRARKIVMLICALIVLPIIFAGGAADEWMAVAIIGFAAAAHQGWSANLFTLVSDMFPKRAVASLVGLGGMAGSIGGVIFSMSAGFILQATGSYATLFYIGASSYLVALLVIHLLAPKLQPATIA
jgi:ACS family hexuronate transporter-like MFS transporter